MIADKMIRSLNIWKTKREVKSDTSERKIRKRFTNENQTVDKIFLESVLFNQEFLTFKDHEHYFFF